MIEAVIPQKVHCVICTNEVPEDRTKHKSITCSKECWQARKLQMRARVDQRICRFCRKPSTPAARGQYFRWESLQRRILNMPSLDTLAAELPELGKKFKAEGKEFSVAQVGELLKFLRDTGKGDDLRRKLVFDDEPEATDPPAEAVEFR